MKDFHRSHFLTVLFSLRKYFWVLLLPVVRTVLALGFDYQNAFRGYEADISVMMILLLHALSRWMFTFIRTDENSITFRKGLLIRKNVTVYDRNISCIKLWHNPFSVIFSCFILRVYENPSKKPIISIYITKKTAEKIKRKYFSDEKLLCSYKSKPLLHALIFGDNKGGFLLIAALFSFSGIVTGRTIRKLTEDNLSALSEHIRDIPSFLIFIGIALLVVRIVALLLEAASVSGMKIYEKEDTLLIKRGIFRRIFYRINSKKENIGYILLTESIFLKNFYSLYAGINGFGEGKYDIPLIFPIIKTDNLTHLNSENTIRSPKCAISSYITKWIVAFISSVAVCIIALLLAFPLIIFLFPLFIGILSLFLVFVNVNKWRCSYICIKGENIIICALQGVKKNSFITMRKKCNKIKIRQNIFQKRKNIADICFYLRGYSNKKVRLRHMPMEKCMKIIEML